MSVSAERPWPQTVGIVGGGIAGLYTALLLKKQGIAYHIFEGTNRVGGRVNTHYFDSNSSDQYFEAGAMRLPFTNFQKITFDLIDWLNDEQNRLLPKNQTIPIKLIDYHLTTDNNLLYVNGRRHLSPAVTSGTATPNAINWPMKNEQEKELWGDVSANDMLQSTIGKFIDDLKKAADESTQAFEKAFNTIVDKWDDYSFRHFLKIDKRTIDPTGKWNESLPIDPDGKWSVNPQMPDSVIDFLETVSSQTNQFMLSVPELVMQSMDFGITNWKTIDAGMSRLPEAMSRLVGLKHITFGARVHSICALSDKESAAHPDGGVAIEANGYNGTLRVAFDAIVLAVPPAAVKMLMSRPRWSAPKEMAIRSIHFEPLYKMGMRFKTRFWEQDQYVGQDQNELVKASLGGQSTSDLPIRWIVYPSNGIGSDASGVLLLYAWMTDATTWVPLSPIERRSLALECLKQVYDAEISYNGERVPLEDLLIESADAVWSESTATGDAMFLPGQFRSRFDAAQEPEASSNKPGAQKTIFFAGEHLSYHHTWIAGAADSALRTVRRMLGKPNIPPLEITFAQGPDEDEGVPDRAEPVPIEGDYTRSDPLHLGRNRSSVSTPRSPSKGESDSARSSRLPQTLGNGNMHAIGAQLNHLQGPYAA